jgi:hypothetical protein
MRLAPALAALPVLPEADRDEWDPEDMSHVKGANGDGAPWRLARDAVVIAKRNSLRPEMVSAANDEHDDSPDIRGKSKDPALQGSASILSCDILSFFPEKSRLPCSAHETTLRSAV